MPDFARDIHRNNRVDEPDVNGDPDWVEIGYEQRITNVADYDTGIGGANVDLFPNDELIEIGQWGLIRIEPILGAIVDGQLTIRFRFCTKINNLYATSLRASLLTELLMIIYVITKVRLMSVIRSYLSNTLLPESGFILHHLSAGQCRIHSGGCSDLWPRG